jgi:tellurite resistance protein TerC
MPVTLLSTFMLMEPIWAWGVLAVALAVFLWVDLRFFARGREPNFGEAVIWSLGWVALSVVAALVLWWVDGAERAVVFSTVYLIERTLSLDNLFVFLLVFAYFGIPYERRPRLLFWGIVAALVLRAAFILAGVGVIDQFHFVVYVLGAALVVLAVRLSRGMVDKVDPDRSLMVRAVRRLYPVTSEQDGAHWFVKREGRRHVTPLFLCLVAIVFADLAFAIDSIPAAFGITRDPFLIWMGNVFALLGLRALFVLVEGLIERFRFLDQTIAVILGLVGVKLMLEDLVNVRPAISLAVVVALFSGGIALSLVADRRDPDSDRKREQRREQLTGGPRERRAGVG